MSVENRENPERSSCPQYWYRICRNSLEYSQDNKVSFLTKDVGNGINHLICLGKGELKDREVLHLYADTSGNISESQSLFGEEERAATYDYGSVESTEELRKGGEERLRELMRLQGVFHDCRGVYGRYRGHCRRPGVYHGLPD